MTHHATPLPPSRAAIRRHDQERILAAERHAIENEDPALNRAGVR